MMQLDRSHDTGSIRMRQFTLPFIAIFVLASVLTETQLSQGGVSSNSLGKITHPLARGKSARAVGEKPHHKKSVKELVYDLVKGTVDESQIVYRNISRIFLNSFTTTTTTPNPDEIEADNTTTTTPAPEFKIQDFYRLVGINYRGLNRLFLSEFQLALKDSIKNVGQFKNDLRLSFFPFLRPDPRYSGHNVTQKNQTST
ncbi:hypothetical protein M8J76_002720 [Diaphorina citri]|nr:hypothetical protein M8J76_002720 [Diaphorina citri]